MKVRSGFDLAVGMQVFMLAIWLFATGCWIVNGYKLVKCDWSNEGTWKGEIVHGIGLAGPLSMFTVWNNDK